MRKIRFYLTIFGIFVNSLADAKVYEAPMSMGNSKIEISDALAPLAEKAFSTIRSSEPVLTLLPNKSFPVTNITLNLEKQGLGLVSEFDRETGGIVISIADCDAPWNSEIRSAYYGVFIHEYGHAIFEANAREIYGHRIDISVEKEFGRKYARLVLKNQLDEASRLPMPPICMLLPFNELFADTIAVIMTGDPSTISKFMSTCQPELELDFRRDFRVNYPLEGWDKGSLACQLMSDAHLVMNPSRSHIWRTLQEMVNYDSNARAKVLHATLEASFRTLQQLTADGPVTRGKWTSLPIENLNRMFILNFDQLLVRPEK